MIDLYGKYKLPNKWEELTPTQYLGIIPILLKFMAGEITLGEAKIYIFCLIANVDPTKVGKDNWLMFCENVFAITSDYNFFYRFVYDDERFESLSEKVKAQLAKKMPADIKSHEAKVAAKMKSAPTLDACFCKNLLPDFKYDGVRYMGYKFDLNGAIPTTTIKGEQFIDAQSTIDLYSKTKDDAYLDLLVHILYPQGEYCSAVAATRSREFKFNDTIRQAVYLNYQAILLWLFTKTDYSILWGEGKNQKTASIPKIEMGLRQTLYSFSKQYGSLDQVKRYDLITFLDLMLSELIESVKTLHESGMKKDEICEKTELSLTVINKIL